MKIGLKLDKYDREARLYPAIITVIPLILLIIYFTDNNFVGFIYKISVLVFVGTSLTAIFIYFLMELNRFISKFFIEKFYFSSESKFPTSVILLYSDSTYSDSFKAKIFKKIFNDFEIKLPTREEEDANKDESLKQINEAISLIRAKVKSGRLVLRHNIHYGAARNLVGGSILGIFISLFDVYIFYYVIQNSSALNLSLILLGFYLIILLSSKFVLFNQGKSYAKCLIQEYLNT